MASQVGTVYIPSSDHTKILTKLQSNQYMKLSEVWLNRISMTRSPQIIGHFKTVGGVET